MAHITLPEGVPGIGGPLRAYPETARHLLGLAQTLLRGPSPLTPAERELIASYVSAQNCTSFCQLSHGAAAKHLLLSEMDSAKAEATVRQVQTDFASADISDKLKTLLVIAGKVQIGGRNVTEADIEKARTAGADDKAIHDTVLIAAAFCMYNRYVDGLATLIPDESAYDSMGAALAQHGYQRD